MTSHEKLLREALKYIDHQLHCAKHDCGDCTCGASVLRRDIARVLDKQPNPPPVEKLSLCHRYGLCVTEESPPDPIVQAMQKRCPVCPKRETP